MPVSLDWIEIARRLAFALLAGSLMGLNRSERGRPAGLRTTTLVTLAAAAAMIQTNLLLSTAGKTAGSFVQIDVMRLPLGHSGRDGFHRRGRRFPGSPWRQ